MLCGRCPPTHFSCRQQAARCSGSLQRLLSVSSCVGVCTAAAVAAWVAVLAVLTPPRPPWMLQSLLVMRLYIHFKLS